MPRKMSGIHYSWTVFLQRRGLQPLWSLGIALYNAFGLGDDMSIEDMKATIHRVRDNLKITKVVCTRSVKGRGGDAFCGFSAAWNSVQEDGGQGVMEVGDNSQSGMSFKDAKVAGYLLGMQADITAFENAAAGSIIRKSEADEAVLAIKHNYGKLMGTLLGEKE